MLLSEARQILEDNGYKLDAFYVFREYFDKNGIEYSEENNPQEVPEWYDDMVDTPVLEFYKDGVHGKITFRAKGRSDDQFRGTMGMVWKLYIEEDGRMLDEGGFDNPKRVIWTLDKYYGI